MSRVSFLALLAACLLLSSAAQMDFTDYSAYEDVDLSSSTAFYTSAAAPPRLYYNVEDVDTSAFSAYGQEALPALTRPALFKQRPTLTERVAIPVLLSSSRTQKAAPIVQKTLTESRPTVVQAVKAHPTFERLQTLREAATVPLLQSSQQTQKAAPIVQKALTETRPELLQTVKAHPSKEVRPTLTEAVQVPLMESRETTQKAAPIVQKTLTETRPTLVQEAPASQKK